MFFDTVDLFNNLNTLWLKMDYEKSYFGLEYSVVILKGKRIRAINEYFVMCDFWIFRQKLKR